MSVLNCLTREHRLFERLLERLRQGIESSGDHASALLITETLQVMLPALDRHDVLEDLVFGQPGPSMGVDEKRARELVEAQHMALQRLREDVHDLLRDHTAPLPRLKSLAELLAGRLEWHFKTEEMLLWPLQVKTCSRSVGHSLELRAEKNVRDLEKAVARFSNVAAGRMGAI